MIIRRGVPIPRARKIAVSIFGLMTAGSLILGPFIIHTPPMALIVLAVAGFGYASYTANSMAIPGDVVPKSTLASVWGLASVGFGLGGTLFQFFSGISVDKLSKTYNYSVAYNSVFIGYGVLALLGLLAILFLTGPLGKDEQLHEYALQGEIEAV